MAHRRQPDVVTLGPLLVMAIVAVGMLPSLAHAQKYPGTPLQPTPAAPLPRPQAPMFTPPAPSPAPSLAPAPLVDASAERDSDARSLAARLPLDPATANLRNRLPADVAGTIRRLGLRTPNGTRTDLRGQTPTVTEIVNALAH